MADYTLTQAEISVILWCMESMASDFTEGEDPDFESAFAKIEATSDKMDSGDTAALIV